MKIWIQNYENYKQKNCITVMTEWGREIGDLRNCQENKVQIQKQNLNGPKTKLHFLFPI